MRRAQNGLPASYAAPGPVEFPLDDTSGLVAEADCEPCGAFGIDKAGDLGGHTLLSRALAPQGRRSLFRR
jgi:hypothetical protein